MRKLLISSVERVEIIVPRLKFGTKNFIGVKCMLNWHNRGLRLYFDLYAVYVNRKILV